jgi:hypothetical protein
MHFLLPRIARTAAAALLVGSLAACNGAANNVIGGITNNAYVRVLHGSPDAGSLDIAIDSASNLIKTGDVYGNLTAYQQVKAGSHTLYIFANGQDTGSGIVPPITFSVNGGSDTTVVLSGEMHPSYQTAANFGATTFAEQPFSVPSAGAGVVFHNAAPFAAAALGLNASSVQFGYSLNSAPANNNLGNPQSLGGFTSIQSAGLPTSALNTPITFYGVNDATVTVTPGQISSACTNNQVPCTAPGLSLYLVDGPAASLTPNVPTGYWAPTAKAVFFGAFDRDGLLTQ